MHNYFAQNKISSCTVKRIFGSSAVLQFGVLAARVVFKGGENPRYFPSPVFPFQLVCWELHRQGSLHAPSRWQFCVFPVSAAFSNKYHPGHLFAPKTSIFAGQIAHCCHRSNDKVNSTNSFSARRTAFSF